MRISAPDGSPAWLAPFAQQINDALNTLLGKPQQPAPLYAVANAAALAVLAPKDNPERLIYVRDIARLAVSNGVNWLRMDTGVTL
jgi:phage tail sheath gpL-like